VGHDLSHLAIFVWVGWLPRVQAIHIAVEHAKGRRDQNRIVNLFIRGTLLACARDVIKRHVLATFLNLTRNREQQFQFVGDFGAGVVAFDAIDQVVVSTQVFSCRRSVRELAEAAIVLGRDVHCDHFTLGWGESVRAA
jgi:hypothetical protein